MIKKISQFTTLYLKGYNTNNFYIYPGSKIVDNNLVVAYDIRSNTGNLIIPRGTRVSGVWVSEISSNIEIQLIINKIYLSKGTQEIKAVSDVFEINSLPSNIIRISTNEIPVILEDDFIAFPDL
jgi:hypothetical protein